MAEAASAVVDCFKGNIAFINIMANMSVDCDCCAVAEDPCIAEIVGICAGAFQALSFVKSYLKSKKKEDNVENVEESKEKGTENIKTNNTQIEKKNFITNYKEKYKYLFYSYIFDVSLIIIFVLAFITEKTISNL